MKRLAAVWAVLVCGVVASLAGGVPNIPTTPQYSDPSQVLATINTLINQLNGVPAYAPVTSLGLGQACSASGVTPGTPVTCNGQRGILTTATMTTAALSSQSLLINSNTVNLNSLCVANLTNYSGTFSTAGIPIVYALVTSSVAGQIQLFIGNVSTANALSGVLTIGFYCYN